MVLLDPPWLFRVWHNATGQGRSAEKHYRTLSNAQLAALDFYPWLARDCALLVWVTRPKQREVFGIVDAWNARQRYGYQRFEYKTELFTWVKQNRRGLGFFMGLGYYSRANTEGCWLFTRGRLPVARRDVRQLIVAPVRAHSQKPDEQYARIERLWPGRRYLELFARRRRPGWTMLGDSLDGQDIRQALITRLPDSRRAHETMP